jgi:hypothetical protein
MRNGVDGIGGVFLSMRYPGKAMLEISREQPMDGNSRGGWHHHCFSHFSTITRLHVPIPSKPPQQKILVADCGAGAARDRNARPGSCSNSNGSSAADRGWRSRGATRGDGPTPATRDHGEVSG